MSVVIVCDLAAKQDELRAVCSNNTRGEGVVVAVGPAPYPSGARDVRIEETLDLVRSSRRWSLNEPILVEHDYWGKKAVHLAARMVLEAARLTRRTHVIFLVDDCATNEAAIQAFGEAYPEHTVHMCTNSDQVLQSLPDKDETSWSRVNRAAGVCPMCANK